MRKSLLAIVLMLSVAAPARAIDNDDILSLVAMPLAVAAVAEIADVPAGPLFELIALLNDADVPPAEFIEVVRYAPVALVVDAEPDFVDYVRLQTTNGTRGVTLAQSIETELREYGLPGEYLIVEAPRVVTIDQTFVSTALRERIVINRAHPHGGPPGQLKKELGLQTGAEVVHRASRSDRNDVRSDSGKRSKNERKVERKSSRKQSRGEDAITIDRRPTPSRPEAKEKMKGNNGNKGNGKGKKGKDR